MSSLSKVFEKKRGFIGYLTGGDGGIQYSVEAGLALLEGGVDILEIGIPFSDPVADGPTIQKACERALKLGTTPESILQIARQIKKYSPTTPLVLFSYFNPVLQMGDGFTHAARQAGFDGILLLDLPFDDSYYQENDELDPILIVSPSTPPERLEKVSKRGRGFLYYACQKGITGVRSSLPDDLKPQLEKIRRVTSTPVAVGFGISSRESAAEVSKHANGFVVGSAFVRMIEEGASPRQLAEAARKIDPRGVS